MITILKNVPAMLALSALAAVGYVFLAPESVKLPSFASPQKEAISYDVLQLANSRTLHGVKVSRADPDGFVVSCFEGTFKIYNKQLTPDSYTKLQKASPVSSATPLGKSLLDQSTPAKKIKDNESRFGPKS